MFVTLIIVHKFLQDVRLYSFNKIIVIVGYTKETPERTWNGTKRHFFGQPKPELVKAGKIEEINFPDFDFGYKGAKDDKAFKTQYFMFLGIYKSVRCG